MKIITTDEEIARFVAINLVMAIDNISPGSRMTGEHLIGIKNAIKGDIVNNFKKTNETFEIAVNDSLNRKS
jgi:hypothetical protein